LFHSNTIIPLNGNLREHWMYLGGIGFFIYFILVVEKIKKEKLKIILTTLIFTLYGTRTILRNYDWKNPEKFYIKSLKHFPNAKKLIHNYAVVLLIKGEYEKAIFEFKKLEKFYSNKKELAKITLGISRCYFMLGNYKEAEEYYNRTLQLDPFNFGALTGLAYLFEIKKDIERSLYYLKKSIQINPYFPPTFYLLGKIYLDKKDYEMAEKVFIKCIELEPDESIYWNKLGVIYFDRNEFEKSLYCLRNAYKFKKDDFIITLNLARVYQRLNRHNDSIFYFEKTFEIAPSVIKENPDVLNDYAISLNEIGQKQRAIEILNYILKKNPNYEKAKINLKIIMSN
ncbi:MAG: tetratricopeptide repeat protein, partial [bacterium]|nr:tetratricopeptide repeat protein [bacterium]MDW8164290.1 tetratricopeptide repeat protein [Candidatus Omnitrophota bacterium]